VFFIGKMHDLQSTGGATYNLNDHIVWCPTYRRSILTGPIAKRCGEMLQAIAAKWGFTIIAQEVMPDHIHLFVSAPPKYSPAKIAQLFKGATSHDLREEFPQIKKYIWKIGTLWSPSYYAGTAGNMSAETVRRYIQECQHK
jgi:putative transposase